MASRRSPTAGPTLLSLGNDVVDLSHPRCRDMPLSGRFVERVFTDPERERILRAPEPRPALWRTWAAKEAAYKVVTKLLGSPPPFVHRRFVVTGEGPGAGWVTYGDVIVPFRSEPSTGADALHVVAWSPSTPPDIEARVLPLPTDPAPVHLLSDREKAAVHTAASGWVRYAARARAAALLERPEAEVEIVCDPGPPGRTPPRLLVGGRPSTWDVSLSHHGRWVAWALGRAVGPTGGPGPRQVRAGS